MGTQIYAGLFPSPSAPCRGRTYDFAGLSADDESVVKAKGLLRALLWDAGYSNFDVVDAFGVAEGIERRAQQGLVVNFDRAGSALGAAPLVGSVFRQDAVTVVSDDSVVREHPLAQWRWVHWLSFGPSWPPSCLAEFQEVLELLPPWCEGTVAARMNRSLLGLVGKIPALAQPFVGPGQWHSLWPREDHQELVRRLETGKLWPGVECVGVRPFHGVQLINDWLRFGYGQQYDKTRQDGGYDVPQPRDPQHEAIAGHAYLDLVEQEARRLGVAPRAWLPAPSLKHHNQGEHVTNLYQWALRMERSDKRQKGGVPIGHTPSEDDGELATRSMNSSYWLRW